MTSAPGPYSVKRWVTASLIPPAAQARRAAVDNYLPAHWKRPRLSSIAAGEYAVGAAR